MEDQIRGDDLEHALQASLAGDERAFMTLWADINPRLLRYLQVLVGPHDAEDVASETWIQAMRDLSTFSGSLDGFRGWVSTIGRNRALDHLRATGRRPLPRDPDLLRESEPDAVAASGIEEFLGTQWAVDMIASLPTEQAEAIMLRVVFGLDSKAAGSVLGRRPGAVRTATHRGLKSLARTLSNTLPVPDAEGL